MLFHQHKRRRAAWTPGHVPFQDFSRKLVQYSRSTCTGRHPFFNNAKHCFPSLILELSCTLGTTLPKARHPPPTPCPPASTTTPPSETASMVGTPSGWPSACTAASCWRPRESIYTTMTHVDGNREATKPAQKTQYQKQNRLTPRKARDLTHRMLRKPKTWRLQQANHSGATSAVRQVHRCEAAPKTSRTKEEAKATCCRLFARIQLRHLFRIPVKAVLETKLRSPFGRPPQTVAGKEKPSAGPALPGHARIWPVHLLRALPPPVPPPARRPWQALIDKRGGEEKRETGIAEKKLFEPQNTLGREKGWLGWLVGTRAK